MFYLLLGNANPSTHSTWTHFEQLLVRIFIKLKVSTTGVLIHTILFFLLSALTDTQDTAQTIIADQRACEKGGGRGLLLRAHWPALCYAYQKWHSNEKIISCIRISHALFYIVFVFPVLQTKIIESWNFSYITDPKCFNVFAAKLWLEFQALWLLRQSWPCMMVMLQVYFFHAEYCYWPTRWSSSDEFYGTGINVGWFWVHLNIIHQESLADNYHYQPAQRQIFGFLQKNYYLQGRREK